MNVVIPAAGLGKRMRSYGPKALIELKQETVLSRQVRLVREVFPKSRILVVAGFEAARVAKACKELGRVECVVNEDFEESNVAYSIRQGLARFSRHQGVLVIYGDLVFSRETLQSLDKRESSVIIDNRNEEYRDQEVGVTVVDDVVTTFSFGLPSKWAHLAYLAPAEKLLFQSIASEPHRKRQYGFEILNEVIERGGKFQAVLPNKLDLAEIDTSKDISRALQIP